MREQGSRVVLEHSSLTWVLLFIITEVLQKPCYNLLNLGTNITGNTDEIVQTSIVH